MSGLGVYIVGLGVSNGKCWIFTIDCQYAWALSFPPRKPPHTIPPKLYHFSNNLRGKVWQGGKPRFKNNHHSLWLAVVQDKCYLHKCSSYKIRYAEAFPDDMLLTICKCYYITRSQLALLYRSPIQVVDSGDISARWPGPVSHRGNGPIVQTLCHDKVWTGNEGLP